MSYNKVGISFFGHRNIAAETAKTVEKKLFDYLNDFVCFYIRQNKKIVCFCGGYGDFDAMVSRVIDKLRVKYKGFAGFALEKIFVTPPVRPSYLERNEIMKTHYDEVLYPPLESVPYKFAILKRNEWIVENSDYVVCYVDFSFGGAYKAMRYARYKLGKDSVYNLGSK